MRRQIHLVIYLLLYSNTQNVPALLSHLLIQQPTTPTSPYLLSPEYSGLSDKQTHTHLEVMPSITSLS